MIEIDCPHCGKTHFIDNEMAKGTFVCAGCNALWRFRNSLVIH